MKGGEAPAMECRGKQINECDLEKRISVLQDSVMSHIGGSRAIIRSVCVQVKFRLH